MEKRFSILAGTSTTWRSPRALWVASTPSGELRKIDPRTNEVVLRRELQAQLCCVAAGGGYVWAASNPDGVVWKLTSNGRVLPTIELRSAVETLTYADGALWAALGEQGTIVRIDPTTNATREYDLGHSVTSVDVRDGLVAAGVRQSVADLTRDLTGNVVWVGRKASTLFDSGAATDPAFTAPTWDAPQLQFHYATCARLLNYADAEGEAGMRLVPEVAEAMPEVSDGGRTYTFRIRKGFGFSPPSNEEVTAESFRHAIERVLSPKFDYVVPQARTSSASRGTEPARRLTSRGVSAQDGRLVIRLREPAPDLPWIAALSCAVPAGTPVVADGGEDAGCLGRALLPVGAHRLVRDPRAEPELRRDAPAAPRRDRLRFNVAPGAAVSQIEDATLDYFLESQNPTLTPNTAAARNGGDRYRLYAGVRRGCHLPRLQHERPLFASLRLRRAVQYAIDRVALAGAADEVGIPATRLLSPAVPGYDATPLYPPRGDLRRRSSSPEGGKATPSSTRGSTRPIRTRSTARCGSSSRRSGSARPSSGWTSPRARAREGQARADLIWGGLNANTPDPAAYLQPLAYLPPEYSDEIRRISTLSSPIRERAAATLARRIDHDSLFAVYATRAMPELVSRRLGCIVHHPVYAASISPRSASATRTADQPRTPRRTSAVARRRR